MIIKLLCLHLKDTLIYPIIVPYRLLKTPRSNALIVVIENIVLRPKRVLNVNVTWICFKEMTTDTNKKK